MANDEDKKLNTFAGQKDENDRLHLTGEAPLDYTYEAPRDRLIEEQKIKEELLKNPVIKAEYRKAYYRTADITYSAKVVRPRFDKQKIKIYIYQAIIWALLLAETIIASVGPKYFSFGTLFDLAYLGLSIYILITIIKTKYHEKGEFLLNKTVMRAKQNKYDLVEVSQSFGAIFWISIILLCAGTIVDITNIGINVHVVYLPLVFIQVALVGALFIIFTLYTYGVKDLYGYYRMVIGHGEIRETIPDKDTVYDFDDDEIYTRRDFFRLNKDLKEYNEGI